MDNYIQYILEIIELKKENKELKEDNKKLTMQIDDKNNIVEKLRNKKLL
jgi:non-homologous end joining protein Ku